MLEINLQDGKVLNDRTQKPTSVNKKKVSFEFKQIKLFDTFSAKKKQIFYNDLGILLSSGVDLASALDLVINDFNKAKDKNFIAQLKRNLVKGLSFADTIKDSGYFSAYEYYSIKIGEESGKLKDILTELANYVQGKIQQKRKIISAFSYPAIVLLTAITAIVFMLNFIVPMFEDIFARFDKDLPALTRFVINIAENFSRYLFVAIVFMLALIFIHIIYKRALWYRKLISHLILHSPIFGKLVAKMMLARFSLTMELLLSARTPVLESIKLSANMTRLYAFQHALTQIEKDILSGLSLNESMQKHKIFDSRMIALIKVAEEINQLDSIFKQLKKQFNDDIEYQAGIISSVMEPMLIVFIGLFVGLILVSMYLPIFQISTSFM